MKIYISGMAKTRMAEVEAALQKIRAAGHQISFDWTKSSVKKPYRDTRHRKHNMTAYEGMLEGAAEADVFVLLDGEGLRGAYVELGAFLFEALKNPKNKKVFIVGADSAEREHIFESPDFVHFVDSLEDVYKDLDG